MSVIAAALISLIVNNTDATVTETPHRDTHSAGVPTFNLRMSMPPDLLEALLEEIAPLYGLPMSTHGNRASAPDTNQTTERRCVAYRFVGHCCTTCSVA